MKIEELNKTQIVLLTLFVSFVTSIATGITTVTLMDQAPPAITQTLNRVVEKTIERVIQPASVITKEVKVVVKEEDLIVNAVDKNVPHIALVTGSANTQNTDAVDIALPKSGIGFLVSSDGYVAVDSGILSAGVSSYQARFPDGKSFNADIATTSEFITLLRLHATEQAPAENKTDGQKIIDSVKQAVGIQAESQFVPVSFGSMSAIKLGQSVIAFGGKMGDEISTGIISRIEQNSTIEKAEEGDSVKDTTAQSISAIYTNIALSSESSGGPLINTEGEVVGMNIVRGNRAFAVPSDLITSLLNALAPSSQAKP
ncbi:MAG: trypsin-like peptidase domain-containing protein [Parcubacteria group bacterium]|nr:trypsin-like peptidase domain-containing protein [Parcubacteria group bacterium]